MVPAPRPLRLSGRGEPSLELLVSRRARDLYRFDESLFALRGRAVFANLLGARLFVQRMNERRDLIAFPERAVKAGEVHAAGLLHEAFHHVLALYRKERSPDLLPRALVWLEDRLSPEEVDGTLLAFAREFPPSPVYQGKLSAEQYLAGQSEGLPNREILLEELLLLWLANANPALADYRELFEDEELQRLTAYGQVMAGLQTFLDGEPPFGPDAEPLHLLVGRPAQEVPHSLAGQIEYILERWGHLLGGYLYRLLRSLDVLREEAKTAPLGPGPARVHDFAGLELEEERYSTDREWMPRLVLLAKNTHVWLDQLSRQYGQAISRLDHIPEQELDVLARRGINALWLIGLWERSPASQQIKQLMGNPEAVASAYALLDYRIAEDLGGEHALAELRRRAWQRGIRLASDMVPNHMGIDSRWVMEHPEWFVQLDHSPFPGYRFDGPDLSRHEGVGIFLESHYYDRSDAAVVFRRVERRTGEERYIYHGNDGTTMPWNDTAQLNYLLPEVREAVIQTILHVARQFPVIRFDAAMTLTRRHYQRLWFPEPGSGGAIPSRAEHGLTREQFHAQMPQEFWRQVVERVAEEAPDTLLLAEAFWLMEGYFVRTLGMHRVYNSAFMNMLRDEKNAEYRQLIKNTLEFDPQILGRYVNFMSNPDERTAVEQFGTGDKYFGVCTLMVTLPGLPMFAHGQIEGLAEKYGMEYRRAYWEEQPDATLVERHEREIFPLLHRRHLFARAEGFVLYDFFTPDGQVNEDVFAYSSRLGEERALVVFNNRYAEARGWIRTSAAQAEKTADGGRRLVQRSLGEGLGLQSGTERFCILRDHTSGLEYMRSTAQLFQQGLYVELGAYQSHVFLGLREVQGEPYAQLAAFLDGRGVPSVEEARGELLLQPVQRPFRRLVKAGFLRRLMDARVIAPQEVVEEALLEEVEARMGELLRGAGQLSGGRGDEASQAASLRRPLLALLELPVLDSRVGPGGAPAAVARVQAHLQDDPAAWGTLLAWVFSRCLGGAAGPELAGERARSWLEEWRLEGITAGALGELGLEEAAAWRQVQLLRCLLGHEGWYREALEPGPLLEAWLQDPDVQRFLQVNRFLDVLWFQHEAFHQLLGALLAAAAVQLSAAELSPTEMEVELAAAYHRVRALERAELASQYQVEKLLEAARKL